MQFDAFMPAVRKSFVKWIIRFSIALPAVVLLAACVFFMWAYFTLSASLPVLDGKEILAGLSAEVTIERDDVGVPLITGKNRLDVARATGFLHGQERFFQMDLSRRRSAGELSELFGAEALPLDRSVRRHRFRARAQKLVDSMAKEDRRLLIAYTEGVSAGLSYLNEVPFEYILIGEKPRRWALEDSILSVMAMYVFLQEEDGATESALGVMHDFFPQSLFNFLAPTGTEWDAPVDGKPLKTPPIPGPEVFNLRSLQTMLGDPRLPGSRAFNFAKASLNHSIVITRRSCQRSEVGPAGRKGSARISLRPAAPRYHSTRSRGGPPCPPDALDRRTIGSNNWAVSGKHTKTGAAMLANDMHLGLSVPNTWYRVSIKYTDTDGAERHVTGVTLPGMPAVVAGSNGHVAWGFTNSYGDFSDLVIIETAPGNENAYLTPDGAKKFTEHTETIRIKDADDVKLKIMETIWGPVIDKDHRGRMRAYRWVAHDERAIDFGIIKMEKAESAAMALDTAARSCIPAQNFVAADSSGNIGWTIIGSIPVRSGFDGRLPSSWADGSRGWNGWLEPAEYPRIVNPPAGRIWTANARVAGGRMLEKLGFGGYALGARAKEIRDRLFSIKSAAEKNMLEVQLDVRSAVLGRWKNLLLETLENEKARSHPWTKTLRSYLEKWDGRASVESVAYTYVKVFRQYTTSRVFSPFASMCRKKDESFDYVRTVSQLEGPLWKLVSERPPHLLNPEFSSWEELLVSVYEEITSDLSEDGSSIEEHKWGKYNRAVIQHPMSPYIPLVGKLFDMPYDPLPGDSLTIRVQGPSFGASERMVVTPGREQDAIFHMPAGQSGHPLSPFYRAEHDAWVKGEAKPFLPGPARHVLRLLPAKKNNEPAP